MRKLSKLFGFLSIAIIISAIAFFFWAKSATTSSENYNKTVTYRVIPSVRQDSTLRVMSYNIGYLSGMTNNLAVRPSSGFYNKNEKNVLKNIATTDADIIGFQEIDYDSKRSYHLNQSEYIAEQMYPYAVDAVNWDKRYVPFPYYPISVQFGKILSGQSILSKFPLKNAKRIVLQKVKSQPFYYKALYLDRIVQVVTVEHPVKPFTFINIHAEAFDQETRNQHLQTIYNLFWEASKQGAVILVGDFNSDPKVTGEAISLFLDDKRIGSAVTSEENFPKSYPSNSPKERLDYIFFTNKDFDLLSSDILQYYGEISDHLPCYAVLKFKREK